MSTDLKESYEPYLASHLMEGEQLIVACVTRIPFGTSFTPSRSRGSWRHVEAVLEALAPSEWFDWLVFGRAMAGPQTSLATRWFLARDPDAPCGDLLVLTDRRLLWCGLTSEPLGHFSYRGLGRKDVPDDLVRVVAAVNRDEIASARVGRYRLQSGRLWITFRDGSWLAFAGNRRRRVCHERIAAEIMLLPSESPTRTPRPPLAT